MIMGLIFGGRLGLNRDPVILSIVQSFLDTKKSVKHFSWKSEMYLFGIIYMAWE